ncbi:MAG: transcriptional regulator NrdR [Elusimicrobiota bacterium]|jgi:transcriptional repressor NrdR|nr:transcriptional regulator NrdR [Elusimicrobiota bacterium]
MKCPFCGSFNGQVLDTRQTERSSAVRRRRVCLECKKRFTTFERLEDFTIMVVKSDQRREPFDIKKVREGIMRAVEKRPVSVEAVDALVNEVEQDLTKEYVMEISSSAIGEKILEKLWDIDMVAYIRFVSVYRKFADIDTFMQELKKLKKENLKRERSRSQL